ncbi:diguanylate cyclase [uncultured Paraglaciecola sp.]|uniref:diguanylate cyclase n=1 Tax=uncultured Paraglaciecola sp. TaxID=1765024 RepID=UPI0030D81AF8
MSWKKLLQIVGVLTFMSYQTHAQMISKQGLLQLQSNFHEAEKQLDARLADTSSNAPASIELNLQKAQLYMLYQRADLLQSLLSEIQQQVFAQDDAVVQSHWHLLNGIQFYLFGKYAQADNSFKSSLGLLEDQNLQQENAYLENFILMYQAVNRVYLQQYETALNALTAVYKNAEKNNWPLIQARSLVFIGDVNYALKNYEQALEYYQNAYNTYPKNALIYRAETLMYDAQMVNIVGERSLAFAQLEQAMDVFVEQQDDTRLANAYLLKSYFYSKVPDDAKALEWIAKSVEKREALGNPIDIANAYVHYSSQLGTNGQIPLALEYAKKAADLAEMQEDIAGQWDAYGNYANLLNQAGDYQQAFHFMRLSERALLKKARLDITSQTATLNAEFNLKREQLKSEFLNEQGLLLEERNTLLNAQLLMEQQHQRQQNWVVMVLSAALVFFLIMCAVIYRLYIKNKVLASRDPLTSLHNRRSVLMLGEQAINSSDRYQYAVSVLMLDIDNFKAVNDSFGHETGDSVIQYVADICIATLRKPDYVGRVGGEEFLLVLPHTDESAALLLAQRLCKQVVTADKKSIGQVKQVTVSIGIATKNINSDQPHNRSVDKDLNQLIREADAALYVAKDKGRNQVQVYHTDLELKDHAVNLEATMPDMLRT